MGPEDAGMTPATRSPEIVRRVDLSIPEGSDVKTFLGELSYLAARKGLREPAVLERRDEVRRVRVELVGAADAIADILERPGQRRRSTPHTPPGGDVVLEGFHPRIVRDEVLPPPGASDPVYPDPEPLRRIGVPWDPTAYPPVTGGEPTKEPTKDVIVAIVDSGIMTRHEDVKDHLWEQPGYPNVRGTSVIGDKDDIEDKVGHGTLLAGTVLAAANRSPAVKLMTVKFIDGRTRPDGEHAADAIDWALDHGAHIINLSWELGIESPGPRLREAVEHARLAGVLVVVAAGNSGADNDKYPAFPACYGQAFDNVITVMATDRFDDKPGFSNYGEKSVHIAAPGVGIMSTHQHMARDNRWRYQRYDGTSAAAAYVAGAAAFLKTTCPGIGPKALRECLIATADIRPDLRCQAQGRLNLGRALEYIAAPAAARSV
jgi:subtilisin family serine protease